MLSNFSKARGTKILRMNSNLSLSDPKHARASPGCSGRDTEIPANQAWGRSQSAQHTCGVCFPGGQVCVRRMRRTRVSYTWLLT